MKMNHGVTNVCLFKTDDGKTMYMLDDRARHVWINALQIIYSAIKDDPHNKPAGWNQYDNNAITTMFKWLEEGRDFNKSQFTKLGFALRKLKLPSGIQSWNKALGLTYGYKMSSNEAHETLMMRRNRGDRIKTLKQARASLQNAEVSLDNAKHEVNVARNNFESLFELEEVA